MREMNKHIQPPVLEAAGPNGIYGHEVRHWPMQ
jgi:hypothetical protein